MNTMAGRIAAAERRAQEAADRTAALMERILASGSNALPAGAPAPGAQTPAVPENLFNLEALPWDKIVGDEPVDPALVPILDRFTRAIAAQGNENLRAILKQTVSPLEPIRQTHEQILRQNQIWSQAEEAAFDDGSPAFPELQDPQTKALLMNTLQRMAADGYLGLNREMAFTPFGVNFVIADYRNYLSKQGGNGNGSAQPSPQAQQIAGQALEVARRSAAARGALPAGNGAQPIPVKPDSQLSEEERVKRSFAAASPNQSSGWGQTRG
jgi:hypothetical protein